MQNSVAMFTFSDFDRKYHFWVNLVQKNQNCQFILKFGTWTNSNMQNSMAMFIFSAFRWDYPFWANLVQLIKIVRLSWNLVPRLIRICKINVMVHLIYFRLKIPFFGKFGPKYQNCQFILKFGTWTNSNMQNSMVMFTF